MTLLLVVAGLVAGCAQDEDPGTQEGPQVPVTGEAPSAGDGTAAGEPAGGEVAGAPVVTEDEAREILATYNDTGNTANATLDSELLATIESGAALAIDDAVYRTGHVLDPDNADPIQPFTWSEPEFHIPAAPADGSAPWFVAEAAVDGGSTRYAMVFTSADGGGTWTVPWYAAVGEGLPPLAAGADGTAVAVPAGAADDLAATVEEVPAAHAAYLTEGASSPHAERFARDPSSRQIIKRAYLPKKFREVRSRSREVTAADEPVRALETADGGAAVFYATELRSTVRDMEQVVTLGAQEAALAGTDALFGGATFTTVNMWLAQVPPGGAGRVSILADRDGLVGIDEVAASELPAPG